MRRLNVIVKAKRTQAWNKPPTRLNASIPHFTDDLMGVVQVTLRVRPPLIRLYQPSTAELAILDARGLHRVYPMLGPDVSELFVHRIEVRAIALKATTFGVEGTRTKKNM